MASEMPYIWYKDIKCKLVFKGIEARIILAMHFESCSTNEKTNQFVEVAILY